MKKESHKPSKHDELAAFILFLLTAVIVVGFIFTKTI